MNRALPWLALAAALKVLLFSALFPPFNNVDEAFHYDNVLKYAAGHWPADMEAFSPDGARAASKGSTAYFGKDLSPDPEPRWRERINHVSIQPPVYYALAALWSKVSSSPYWLRTLNAPVAALMVWCVWLFAGRAFPDKPSIRSGAAVLMAAWPQDAFYGVSNDPLAGLLFGAALLLLLEEKKTAAPALAVGAAFLAKLPNMALILLALRRPRVLALALLVPALWLARNYMSFGDLTGSGRYAELLGWQTKGLPGLFDHPVWHPGGMLFFLSELAKTFWRGEFFWEGRRLSWAAADWLYVLTSPVIFAAGFHKKELRWGWAALLLMFGFLLGSSVIYRFTPGWYPSPDYPYLASGRLICGAAVPFFSFYAAGLERLLGKRAPWALGLVAAVAVLSESALAWKALR